jgi:hypothetical protein
MSHGYAVTNAVTGLAATAFTWSSAYAVDRNRLNDAIQDRLAASGSTAQASGQTLSIDLGSAQSLAGFALLNHNLASGACTVAVTAGTDGITYGTTAKAASTIVTLAPNQKDTVLQFPAASFRYWRLTFVHTGTKIVTLGEVLALASITVLTRTTIYGAGEEERYVVNQVESKTGHLRATFVGGPIRTKLLPFKDLNPAEKAELRAMWAATRGGVSNLLWIEFVESTSVAATADAQECLWGKIAPMFGWKNNDFRLFDEIAFRLVGQGREVGS